MLPTLYLVNTNTCIIFQKSLDKIGNDNYNIGNLLNGHIRRTTMSKEFGERLWSLLQKQGITQKQLADRINTTEATLSRYVSGDREPKAEMLANIATSLNTTSDYLLGIEKDEFDFPRVERLLARNSSNMTDKERRALISALFGEE